MSNPNTKFIRRGRPEKVRGKDLYITQLYRRIGNRVSSFKVEVTDGNKVVFTKITRCPTKIENFKRKETWAHPGPAYSKGLYADSEALGRAMAAARAFCKTQPKGPQRLTVDERDSARIYVDSPKGNMVVHIEIDGDGFPTVDVAAEPNKGNHLCVQSFAEGETTPVSKPKRASTYNLVEGQLLATFAEIDG